MLCTSCEERQQALLEAGDGTQIVCGHVIVDEEAVLEISSSSSTKSTHQLPSCSGYSKDVAIPPTTQDVKIEPGKKRRFASTQELLKRTNEQIKRKIKPIQKWTTLSEGVLFLMKRVVEVECQTATGPQMGYYAELEDEKEEMINVWISEMIQTESKKHTLTDNDVYIIPLGKAISKKTKFEYNDFVILKDSDM